jgi:hypothetical protein
VFPPRCDDVVGIERKRRNFVVFFKPGFNQGAITFSMPMEDFAASSCI